MIEKPFCSGSVSVVDIRNPDKAYTILEEVRGTK